jgi:hypothetical protein
MVSTDDLDQILFTLLRQFRVEFDRHAVGESVIYTVPTFGTKVIYLNGQEFSKKELDGWNVGYVHPDFDIIEAKQKVVWALVRGGYFHYLHHNFKNTFNKILNDQGWDKALMVYRDTIYKDIPKYAYYRELNDFARKQPSSYILSIDPAFFDFMLAE